MSNFSDFQVPGCSDFYDRLQGMPFIKTHRFLRYVDYSIRDTPIASHVDVRRIIGYQHGVEHRWAMKDRGGDDYLWKMAQAIRDGRFNPENHDGLNLLQVGDVYFVDWNGRHRAAALKGMIGPSLMVPAKVAAVHRIAIAADKSALMRFKDNRLCPPRFWWTPPDFRTLENRQKQGLWKGKLHEVNTPTCSPADKSSRGARVSSARWIITYAKGPWVMAEDVDEARTVYEQATKE